MEVGNLNATPDEPVSHNAAIRKRVILRNASVPPIIQVARARFPAGESAPDHVHPDMWELFICERGAGEIMVGERSTRLAPGIWVLVKPGESHSLKADDDAELVLTTMGVAVGAATPSGN